jgi:hypothetical protein
MNTYYATILVEGVEVGRYVSADNFDDAYAQAEARTQRKHPRAQILVRALQLINSGVRDRDRSLADLLPREASLEPKPKK